MLLHLESLLATDSSLFFVLIASFFAGILASLTPCIYPMIPITLGVINAQKTNSMLTSFLLSSSYALGIASVYATLGYISATSNIMFGQWLAHPAFVAGLICVFLYLAGSMFGFYGMYVPQFMAKKGNGRGGSFLSCFLLGLFTGTAASPCLTPALALLLGFAAKQGSPFIGFITLFTFALGMSLLLVLVGTFSGTLSLLPQAGMWMIEIQKIFGFLLLTVCVYFLQPFLMPHTIMFLYSALLGAASGYYLHQAVSGRNTRFPQLIGGIILATLTLLLIQDGYQQKVTYDQMLAEEADYFE